MALSHSRLGVHCLLSAALLAVLFCAAGNAQDSIVAPPEAPRFDRSYPPVLPGATVEVYKSAGDVQLNANIFTPEEHKAGDRRPAIVFFFGGGWKSGAAGQFYSQCRYLAKRGMVAITVDYRVKNRHGVIPQQCLADAKSAIRWVRQNANRLGVDPSRVVAAGGSAGGHLAAATATIDAFDEPGEERAISSKPNALVLFNPAVQLAAFGDFSPFTAEKLKDIKERTDNDPVSVSPIHHIKTGLPPTMIFHGTKDDAVPYATVKRFSAEMKKAGNRCQLVTFEGRPHGFFNPGRGKTKAEKARSLADFRATMRHTDAFLVSLKYLTARPSAEVPARLASRLNVEYARYGGRAMRMDMFYPKERKPNLPAILVVHGGGWLKGDKEKFRPLAIELAYRGFFTAAVEYRLGGEAKFPAAIHDCNAAVRYLRANSKPLGIDPGRIGAVGGSAGGHLVGLMASGFKVAALQGEGGSADQSSQLQAAIVLAGPLELATGPVADRSRKDPEKSNANKWFGKTVDEAPDLYRLASATTHLDKDTAPLLFMAGEHDNPARNEATRKRLKQLGVETGLIVVPQGKHGCWNRHPFFLPMIDDMHAFFSRQLR